MKNTTLAEKFRNSGYIARREVRFKIAKAIEACGFEIANEYFDSGKTLDHVNIMGVGDSGLKGIYKILGGNSNGERRIQKESAISSGTTCTTRRYHRVGKRYGGGWHK